MLINAPPAPVTIFVDKVLYEKAVELDDALLNRALIDVREWLIKPDSGSTRTGQP